MNHSEQSPNEVFPPTRWSMVLAVRDGGDATSGMRALNELCRIYWQPLYFFARRKGHAPADAEDLTQGFFSELLEHRLFDMADAQQGALRSFLLRSFIHHMMNSQRRARAVKRGSGQVVLSLDWAAAEELFGMEPVHELTPERLYDHRCAVEVVQGALAALAAEQAAAGRGELFEQLRPLIDPDAPASANDGDLVANMSPDAVRQAVSRLRKRLRMIMRSMVADTLANPSEAAIDEELKALQEAM